MSHPGSSLALVLPLLALVHAAAGPAPPGASAGAGVTGLRVADVDGGIHRLGMSTAPEPVALVFLETTCPIANKYAPTLNELAREAEEAGVGFFGVLSDPSLATAAAREHGREYGLSFPVLLDSAGELAGRLGPTHVPEAFVIDADDRVVYRGRIDDRFEAVTRQRATIRSHDLFDALRALAAGGELEPRRTEPVGCVFEAWDAAPDGVAVTYHRDVAPILNANCVECHRAGDVGPFGLGSYDEARRRARMIAQVTGSRTMPPWFAADGWGHFRDERRLSGRQIGVLQEWAEAGAPEGDPADALPPPEFPAARWRLGEPDLVIEMPPFEVPASGDDIYRWFVVPNELDRDRAVVAVDFRPGDPSVVHHCIAYADFTGRARAIDEATPLPGFSVMGDDPDAPGANVPVGGTDTRSQIAGWAPGTQPYVLPPGTAQRLKAGGDFVLEMHYHLSGRATTDRSAVALYFADEPVERYTVGMVIGTENIDIRPGDPEYLRHVWMDVPADIDVIDVSPHMHNLGRNVEVLATLPDGTEEPLIRIDDWDFRWQGAYTYRKPVHLPKGSRIDAFFAYDNSPDNPFNPSVPPIRVREGWRTFDEMCLFYFTVVPEDPSAESALYREMFASFSRSGAPD